MTRKIKVMSVFGTRPEAIKMAPLVLELKRRPEFESLLCVTAQHREMLDSVLDIFKISADYDLNIMQPRQTLSTITSKVLLGLEDVFEKAKPDIVLVHGDTSTTFSAALAAYYAKIKVGHVEAGLRTYDKYSPFPEEMNRRLVGSIADLHFCPTENNRNNLLRENIKNGVYITGNTVIDAMKYTVSDKVDLSLIKDVDFERKKVVVVTCHRRENYGKPMEQIFSALKRLAETNEDIQIVYPVHLSPVVHETAQRILGGISRIKLIPPLDAEQMHTLMSRCYMVMTDSGGIQEEAPALGKPVLVMRRETERPEAVEAGTVRLVGVDEKAIFDSAQELLHDLDSYERMAKAVNPYGDGSACCRIADAIAWDFGLKDAPPRDFEPEKK